jgi:hypothetical protein
MPCCAPSSGVTLRDWSSATCTSMLDERLTVPRVPPPGAPVTAQLVSHSTVAVTVKAWSGWPAEEAR